MSLCFSWLYKVRFSSSLRILNERSILHSDKRNFCNMLDEVEHKKKEDYPNDKGEVEGGSRDKSLEGYIKSDRTKHIPPKFFSYTQELIKNQEVNIQYVQSNDNSSDLFIKALPTSIFRTHFDFRAMNIKFLNDQKDCKHKLLKNLPSHVHEKSDMFMA
ncbi:uncharacterized protein LOC130015281 [Mercurialis annua]|uniref:uncharacterized protein LOC130015281 n=1 Tax=Mercurialis annua TaxID=3986 RepID=UPI0024AD39B6|nr:uncharacterized protein LOC130015281 [Mercurialis annua]